MADLPNAHKENTGELLRELKHDVKGFRRLMRQFHKMDPDELDFSDRNELGLYMMLLDLIFDDAPYLLIRAIKLAARMRLDDAPEKELLSLFKTLSQILQELVSSDGFITDCFARIGKGLEKLYDQ